MSCPKKEATPIDCRPNWLRIHVDMDISIEPSIYNRERRGVSRNNGWKYSLQTGPDVVQIPPPKHESLGSNHQRAVRSTIYGVLIGFSSLAYLNKMLTHGFVGLLHDTTRQPSSYLPRKSNQYLSSLACTLEAQTPSFAADAIPQIAAAQRSSPT